MHEFTPPQNKVLKNEMFIPEPLAGVKRFTSMADGRKADSRVEKWGSSAV